MHLYRCIAFGVVLALYSGCAKEGKASVSHSQSPYQLQFKLEKTIELKTSDPDWTISNIHSLVVNTSGHIAFLDRKKKEAWIADSTGTIIGRLGRYGKGPGEYQSPRSITLDQRGRYHILDFMHNKTLIYDFKGQFLSDFHFQQQNVRKLLHFPNGMTLQKVRIRKSKDDRYLVYLCDSTNTVLHRFIDMKDVNVGYRKIGDYGLAVKGDSLLVSTNLDNRIRIFDINTGDLLDQVLIDEREISKNLFNKSTNFESRNLISKQWFPYSHIRSIDYMEELGVIFVGIMTPVDAKTGRLPPEGDRPHLKVYDSKFRFIQKVETFGLMPFFASCYIYVAVQPEMQEDGHLPNPVIRKYKVLLVDKSI
jgi:WD40 repeat protein